MLRLIFAYEEDSKMNHQNEPAQLRFLEETANQLRQNGFTVEPIEDHHLPVSIEKGRLCRISGKGQRIVPARKRRQYQGTGRFADGD